MHYAMSMRRIRSTIQYRTAQYGTLRVQYNTKIKQQLVTAVTTVVVVARESGWVGLVTVSPVFQGAWNPFGKIQAYDVWSHILL